MIVRIPCPRGVKKEFHGPDDRTAVHEFVSVRCRKLFHELRESVGCVWTHVTSVKKLLHLVGIDRGLVLRQVGRAIGDSAADHLILPTMDAAVFNPVAAIKCNILALAANVLYRLRDIALI